MDRRRVCLFLVALACAILAGCETPSAGLASVASADGVSGTGAAYLTVNRLPNVGGGTGSFLSIDGVLVARIGWGQSYHGVLAPGDHLISVMTHPYYMFRGPAEKRLHVQNGQSYILTLRWKADRLVLM
jgi:hypothetical protein